MDNKYANLPGIARNEPDVYETSTIATPLVNERYDQTNDESSSVQKIHITTQEAHEKFNARILSADNTDFSDSITNRRKMGYQVEPETFEWNQDLAESPFQRLKRLERELNELKYELQTTSSDAPSTDLDSNPTELIKKIELLQKQTTNIHLETIGLKTDGSQIDKKVKKQQLVDHLNQLKKSLTAINQKANVKIEPGTEPKDSIVYKVFSDLDSDDLEKAKRVSELNERIAKLENLFGAKVASVSENQINTLCTNIENKSILGLVENLNSKLVLLESQSLEQIESRLQLITQRVNQLNEKKGAVEDHEKLNKVNELFNMVANWKDMSATVPVIVERLNSLKEIHQKAFEFDSILSRLEVDQDTIKNRLENNSNVLTQLKKQLDSNLDTIKTNFDSLNTRISKIAP